MNTSESSQTKKSPRSSSIDTISLSKVIIFQVVVNLNLAFITKLPPEGQQELKQEIKLVKEELQNQGEQVPCSKKKQTKRKGRKNEQIYSDYPLQLKFVDKFGVLIEKVKQEAKEYYSTVQQLLKALSSYNEYLEKVRGNFDQEFPRICRSVNRVFKSLTNGGELVLEKINDRAYDLEGVMLHAQFPFSPPMKVHSLSGGQKTLIALAIIFGLNAYKPCSLLLLDQADSHLDSNNARAFSRYIRGEVGSQSIVISHRTETIEFGEAFVLVKKIEEGRRVRAQDFSYQEAICKEIEFLRLKGQALKASDNEAELKRMIKSKGAVQGELEMQKQRGERRLIELEEYFKSTPPPSANDELLFRFRCGVVGEQVLNLTQWEKRIKLQEDWVQSVESSSQEQIHLNIFKPVTQRPTIQNFNRQSRTVQRQESKVIKREEKQREKKELSQSKSMRSSNLNKENQSQLASSKILRLLKKQMQRRK